MLKARNGVPSPTVSLNARPQLPSSTWPGLCRSVTFAPISGRLHLLPPVLDGTSQVIARLAPLIPVSSPMSPHQQGSLTSLSNRGPSGPHPTRFPPQALSRVKAASPISYFCVFVSSTGCQGHESEHLTRTSTAHPPPRTSTRHTLATGRQGCTRGGDRSARRKQWS